MATLGVVAWHFDHLCIYGALGDTIIIDVTQPPQQLVVNIQQITKSEVKPDNRGVGVHLLPFCRAVTHYFVIY